MVGVGKGRLIRRSGGLVAGLLALAAMAYPASAHVSVQMYGERALAGKGAVVFLRIGHAEPGKSTTKVEVQIPEGVTGVKPQRIGGWSESATVAPDGKTVATVVWSGGNLPDTSFQDFGIKLTFPKNVGASVPFKVVQTLSDGSELAWIELSAPGAPEPSHPAPFVTLGDPAAVVAVPAPAAPIASRADLRATLDPSRRKVRVLADASSTLAGARYVVRVHGADAVVATGMLDSHGDVARTVSVGAKGSKHAGIAAGTVLDLVAEGAVLASTTVV